MAKIITYAVLNMESLQWVAELEESFEYSGPVLLCKGDSTAEAEEQQTAGFDSQLMNIFNSQYSTQQSQLKYLQSQMQPIINAGGTGYTAAQLASMRTGATDTNAAQYQSAQAALNNQESQASGGSKLTGVAGANTESDAALLNAQAQTNAASQENITAANANLQQQNYWNAVNSLNGVAAQENPLGYAGASSTAGGTVTGLSQAVNAANQSQLLGALGGIAGGVGSVIGGSIIKSCWIAAAIFSEDFYTGFFTNLVRNWLWNVWAKNWYAKPVLWLYAKSGKWAARQPVIINTLRPLFISVASKAWTQNLREKAAL